MKKILTSLTLISCITLSGCGKEVPKSSPASTQAPANSSAEQQTTPTPTNNQEQPSEAATPSAKPDTPTPAVKSDTTPRVSAPASTPTQESPAEPAPASPPPPASAAAPAKPETPVNSISFVIIGDSQVGTILQESQVAVAEGDTVLDVLKRVGKEKNIAVDYRGVGPLAYVQGINSLYEFDRGPKSGWMFKVNGKFGGKSAGSIKVNPGDKVEWLYTLDLGKDLNGGNTQ